MKKRLIIGFLFILLFLSSGCIEIHCKRECENVNGIYISGACPFICYSYCDYNNTIYECSEFLDIVPLIEYERGN